MAYALFWLPHMPKDAVTWPILACQQAQLARMLTGATACLGLAWSAPNPGSCAPQQELCLNKRVPQVTPAGLLPAPDLMGVSGCCGPA